MAIQHITIFQTSDEHGHLANAGRIAALVDKEKADNPGGVMLVSSGDFFAGSAESEQLGPEPSQQILNRSPYDLLAIGNHEIDRGAAYLRQWVKESKATVLAANVSDKASGHLLEGSQPYAVRWLKGIPIGFFGVTTPDMASLAFPGMMGDIQVTDPVPAAQGAVDAMHAQGVKTIFALSHLGDGDDRLADAIPHIDILGGHTHAPWSTPEVVNGDTITRPGAFRASLERIDLWVESATGEVVRKNYTLIPITPDMPEDAVVGPIDQQAEKDVAVLDGKVVGRLSHALHHDDRLADDFDPLVTGLMCQTGGADVAVINKQFVRESLAGGELKVGPALDAMPFTNRLETTTISAGDIGQMMALSARRHDETSLAFGSVGGHYSVKDGRLWDAQAGTVVPDDLPIKIASTDYLVGGGLQYFKPEAVLGVPPLHDLEADRPKIRDVFMRAVTAGQV